MKATSQIKILIYFVISKLFWGVVLGLVAVCRLSLVVASGGYSSLLCAVLIAVVSLVAEHRL